MYRLCTIVRFVKSCLQQGTRYKARTITGSIEDLISNLVRKDLRNTQRRRWEVYAIESGSCLVASLLILVCNIHVHL